MESEEPVGTKPSAKLWTCIPHSVVVLDVVVVDVDDVVVVEELEEVVLEVVVLLVVVVVVVDDVEEVTVVLELAAERALSTPACSSAAPVGDANRLHGRRPPWPAQLALQQWSPAHMNSTPTHIVRPLGQRALPPRSLQQDQ
mmetsp:Transcript_95641/g.274593  ORF Transcript_95641/g.274593 Transcript_95641/m.274593 type:complete len:142 (+) Transcript_95641:675-1100(+)